MVVYVIAIILASCKSDYRQEEWFRNEPPTVYGLQIWLMCSLMAFFALYYKLIKESMAIATRMASVKIRARLQ